MTHQHSKVCSLLAALFAVFCLWPTLPALAADAGTTVAVAPFTHASKSKQKKMQAARARTAIIKAMGKSGNVNVLSWTTVANRAKRQYVTGASLEKPAKVGPIVGKLGGDVVVFGKIDAKNRMTLRITDTHGKNLWVKTVPLKKGVLSPQMAGKFSKAIQAAAQAATSPKGKKNAPPPKKKQNKVREDDAAQDDVEDDSLRGRANASAREEQDDQEDDGWNKRSKSDDSRRAADNADSDDDDGDDWKGGSRRSDRSRDDDSDRGRNDDRWSGDSSSDDDFGSYRPDRDIGPRIFNISADLSLTWRKYKFCNGVEKCGDTPVEGAGHSVDFSTSSPYLGFRLGLELFPAARVRNRYIRGIGLVGNLRMNPGIKVTYSLNGEDKTELNGKEVDFNIAATYRFYYHAGFIRNGWIGLELGYTRYGFTIDDNPLFSSSTHGGFAIGLDAGFPLHRYVVFDLNFTFLPSTSPGDNERAFFSNGGDAASVAANGRGLKFDAGLSFPFSRYIGINILFDYTRFWSDFSKYRDGSTDIIPATALEQYIGISAGLNGRF